MEGGEKVERRNRRIQNTRRNKTAIWKRCIAAAAAMVTVLTGFNYGGLQNVFAEGEERISDRCQLLGR